LVGALEGLGAKKYRALDPIRKASNFRGRCVEYFPCISKFEWFTRLVKSLSDGAR
jgi:hypothetical protein